MVPGVPSDISQKAKLLSQLSGAFMLNNRAPGVNLERRKKKAANGEFWWQMLAYGGRQAGRQADR